MPRSWRLDLTLDPARRVPLHLQLTNAIADGIRRGRLHAGDPLPGSRALAEHLGVSRKTVVTALDELAAQGWVIVSPARGTHVSPTIPATRARAGRAPRDDPYERSPGYALGTPAGSGWPTPLRRRGRIVFDDGAGDARLAPLPALGAAYRSATHALAREGLGYRDPRGDARLRTALATHLNHARGLAITADHVLVTRGSQMAIALAAYVTARHGGDIAMEAPGYEPARAAFELAGARVHPVPVDARGLCTDALERLARTCALRAVYVTPQHHYPTTVPMSACRRTALLDLADKHGFAILEDDYDYEFHFVPRPPIALASLDGGRSVVYVGSLSKLLAASVRVGYLVAPRVVIDLAAHVRASIDRQGDPILERAIASLFEDGILLGHARRVRRVYEERRDALVGALTTHLGGVLEVDVPSGGLAVWATPRAPVDLRAWAERAAAEDVVVEPRAEGLRLGYASLTTAEIARGVERLARTRP